MIVREQQSILLPIITKLSGKLRQKKIHVIFMKFFTFFTVVGDEAEVEEMSADDGVADGVTLSQLDLDPLAERREHLREHDLLVPHGSVGVLLHRGAALQADGKKIKQINMELI